MDKSRRRPARNFSALVKNGRIGGVLSSQTRRVTRLDSALEDARENPAYSLYCTPRLVRQHLPLASVKSNNDSLHQLQSIYDRVEQRNNTSAQSTTRIPTLSTTQLQSAEQSVQVFVAKMRQSADTMDEQTKSALIRALTMIGNNSNFKPSANLGQQYLEPSMAKQYDDLACWYSVGEEIGRGTFGCVRLATHRLSGTPVAIKSYARLHGARSCLPVNSIGKCVIGDSSGDALEWRRVRQEVNVLSKLRPHLSIIRFIEYFETSTRIHVVTERVRGISMCDVLQRAPGQRLTETRAKRIFQQLVVAVEALHTQHVIHRDLKLENVLLDERSGRATIIDFGFSDFEEINEPQTLDNSVLKKQTKKKNFCGTPSYMAPEVVSSERYDGRPVDVWSLGVLLYVMLCGKFPFQGVSFHQLYQKLRCGAQQLVLPPALSISARTLLQALLTVDPGKRPTASSLCCCSWLQNVEPPSRQLTLSLSFEEWPGIQQAVSTALTELYGVKLDLSNLEQTKPGFRRASAIVKLARAVSSRHFVKLVGTLPRVHSLSSDDLQNQQMEETDSESDYQKTPVATEPQPTQHKQQLEKLIGLVKTSLATR